MVTLLKKMLNFSSVNVKRDRLATPILWDALCLAAHTCANCVRRGGMFEKASFTLTLCSLAENKCETSGFLCNAASSRVKPVRFAIILRTPILRVN